jgi:hypothetical protein
MKCSGQVLKWNEMKCFLPHFSPLFHSGCEMKMNEIILQRGSWNEVKWSEIHEIHDMCWKLKLDCEKQKDLLNSIKRQSLESYQSFRPRDFFSHLKDLVIVLIVVKRLETSTSAHIRIVVRVRRPIVRHGNFNNCTWCNDNSWRSRSWLDLHCRFGMNHDCSLDWIHTSLSFPGLRSLSCV